IKNIFSSNNIKGSFFLVSLLEIIDYIINNLNTKDIISFTTIKPKILDIALKYSLDIIPKSSSLIATTRKLTTRVVPSSSTLITGIPI
ncbi:hypothetical protein K490DRAFT_52127, partial [Saccharata proteae CBS 121410]